MADLPTKKISELPLATQLNDIDVLVGVQEGVTKRIAGSLLVDLVKSSSTTLFTPQMFGVTNDGVTDYTVQLRSMHTAANSVPGAKVVYSGIGRVRVQANANILISTSVDFAGCDFKLLNGILNSPDGSVLNRLFYVNDPSVPSYPVTLSAAELVEGACQLTLPETVGCGYLRIGSNKRVGNRTTAPTVNRYFLQGFTVERGGVLAPGGLDTDLTASTITATFFPNPKNWIEIKGLSADESTFNAQELLIIERSLTRVGMPVVQPRGLNTIPLNVNYLLRIFNSCNVVVKESSISAQTTYGGSTYGLSVQNGSLIYFDKATGGGANCWGVMVTNYVNGLYMTDCHLNRFDTHEGAHNVFIKGGSLNGNPYQYGWGGGQIVMDGVTINSNTPTIRARTDYDNNFNGTIVLKNIHYNLGKIVADGTTGVFAMAPIFDAEKLGGDAGSVKWANSIEMSDITVNYVGAQDIVLCRPFNAALQSAGLAVQCPNLISIRRLKSPRSRMIVSIDAAFQSFNAGETGRCKLVLEDFETVPSATYPLINRGNPVSGYAALGPGYDVKVVRVKNYSQYFAAPKSSLVDIYDSQVCAIRAFSGASSAQKINMYNCEIANTLVISGAAQGELGSGAAEMNLRGCTVRTTASLTLATLLQGLAIAAGVTCPLPSGVTAAIAFTGFKSSTLYS